MLQRLQILTQNFLRSAFNKVRSAFNKVRVQYNHHLVEQLLGDVDMSSVTSLYNWTALALTSVGFPSFLGGNNFSLMKPYKKSHMD
jgi:hypothetical protein